jgi:hypothetical protein
MTNLFSITAQSWGAPKANQLILDAIHDLFSAKRRNHMFVGGNIHEMREMVITSGAAGEVIFADFAPTNRDLWGELISLIFSYSVNNNINLTLDLNFNKWIQSNGDRLNKIVNEGAYSSYWQRPMTDYIGIIEAGFITGISDPEKIFKARYSRNKTSYKNIFDVELLPAIARRSTSGMIAAVEDTEFTSKLSHTIRGEVFVALASVGCLTKKAARKVRSDSSEEASEMGVRAIADNITKFKNAAEVLSQVMDTRHTNSALYLARTVPKEYLPFMAVCQNQIVRETVVNRMQEANNV